MLSDFGWHRHHEADHSHHEKEFYKRRGIRHIKYVNERKLAQCAQC